MLFHEIYGLYFQAISAILGEAVGGTLTADSLRTLARQRAFGESILTIPAALGSGEWPLLDARLHTPVQHVPSMPLTTLERRWLKALLLDPRIRLFAPPVGGLEDVEPLFTPDQFVYFDRYGDGDPYQDPAYIARFQTILAALREKRQLRVYFVGHRGTTHALVCQPYRLEYSAKDDKFRLLTSTRAMAATINLARITDCVLLEPGNRQSSPPRPATHTLVLELVDMRNALERAMLHFSHMEKETVRLENRRYRLTLHYDRGDETELLIRVLSFGPMLRVISPDSFIVQLKDRLTKQKGLGQ